MLIPHLPKQISLEGVLDEVVDLKEQDITAFFDLLKNNLNISALIPSSFYLAYYSKMGRDRTYSLPGMVSAFLLQKFISIPSDKILLSFLSLCKLARSFYGFSTIPCASRFSRFKTGLCEQIHDFFNSIVAIVNPICLEMDSVKTAQITYDTTGIEGYV